MDLFTRLSYLFGTEETVMYRRQLVLLREKMFMIDLNEDEERVICSGSLGEGVVYPQSDDDIVYVDERQSVRVYDRFEEAYQHRAFYMIPSEHSPGFCLLQAITETGRIVLQSSKSTREVFAQSQDMNLHGPCASDTLNGVEYDFAPCRVCPYWPAMANEWVLRRRRYGCPSRELIETIVRGGCHVVPIGNPDSPSCDVEWRVSFSLAERSLIHKFNHVQFIIYNLLKFILKRVIEIQIPGVVCSYFIKTTLFYAIETTTSELWVPDKVEDCYRKCLLLFYHFIDTANCPNYFVPANNMIRRKINADNKVPLLSVVAELISRGIVRSLLLLCSKDSSVLSPFLTPTKMECELDIELMSGYLWSETTMRCERCIQHQAEKTMKLVLRKVLSPVLSSCLQMLRLTNSRLPLLIARQLFTFWGLKCINIVFIDAKVNKSRYERLRSGKAMLSIGCNTDITSGRLHLANYMYVIGRITECISVIKTVLSNYAPYSMTPSSISSATTEEIYMRTICHKGYSLLKRVRKGWALPIVFSSLCIDLAPVPIKIVSVVEETETVIFLHPIIYAYFLQGLCFYNTREMTSMNISVSLLQDTLGGLPPSCLHGIFYGRLLLGYMQMHQKDYKSSCRCLSFAYLMRDVVEKKYEMDFSRNVKACGILLACLLNNLLPAES